MRISFFRKITNSSLYYPKTPTKILVKHFKRNSGQRDKTEIKTVRKRAEGNLFILSKRKFKNT